MNRVIDLAVPEFRYVACVFRPYSDIPAVFIFRLCFTQKYLELKNLPMGNKEIFCAIEAKTHNEKHHIAMVNPKPIEKSLAPN